MTGQKIHTRTISDAAITASSSDRYQSGLFFTTRQIDPMAIEIWNMETARPIPLPRWLAVTAACRAPSRCLSNLLASD